MISPSDPGRALVLAVEDDILSLGFMRAVLERSGYRLATAPTLAEAREWLRGDRPDVLLLDLRLPDGYGLDLLRELRQDPLRSTVPVVVVTASVLSVDREQATQAGADGFIAKPYRPQELLAAVGRFTGTTSGGSSLS